MHKQSIKNLYHEVKERAHDRWDEILPMLGIDSSYLVDQHGPCPICMDGGQDRFRFDNMEGRGTYFCNQGHLGHQSKKKSGDGVQMLMDYHGWDYATTMEKLAACLSSGVSMQISETRAKAVKKPKRDPQLVARSLRELWTRSESLQCGDAVDRYLRSRGLVFKEFPRVLRRCDALRYYIKRAGKYEYAGTYQGMIALIQAADGTPISLHRTYLKNGGKAPVEDCRKIMSGTRKINGGAVRLFQPKKALAVAEGIETALAVHILTGLPVWAALTEGLLAEMVIPDDVRTVHIFADNDASSVGQEAGRALQERLKREGRRVTMTIPRDADTDFNDVYLERCRSRAA